MEGITNNLSNPDLILSTGDTDIVMSSLQETNRQTLKNQKDKNAQIEKLNETLLSILCETIECTFCNILKSSSQRLIKQNEQFDQRMQRIRSG